VAIATFFINYADEVAGYSDSKSSKLLAAAQGIFTFGRFFSTFCLQWVDARHILATFISILVILSAMASGIGGTAGITLYMLLFFFERFILLQRLQLIMNVVCASQQYSHWDW
jgi:fucose permease